MVCRVLRVQPLLFDKLPEALKEIEMGRGGREEQQRHAEPLRQTVYQRASLLARIVEHDRERHAGMGSRQQAE